MAAIVRNTSQQVGVMWPKFMKLCSVNENVINHKPKLQRKLKKSRMLHFSHLWAY